MTWFSLCIESHNLYPSTDINETNKQNITRDQIWQITLYQSKRLMSSAPAKEFYQQCCGSACPTWGTRQPQGRDSPQAESHGDTPVMIIIRGWVIINKKLHQETRPDLWKKMSSLGSPLMNQSAKKTSKQYWISNPKQRTRCWKKLTHDKEWLCKRPALLSPQGDPQVNSAPRKSWNYFALIFWLLFVKAMNEKKTTTSSKPEHSTNR